MTPGKLVLLRLYGLTAGRVPAGAAWLRGAITRALIVSRPDRPYVASSRYFDPAELGPLPEPPEPPEPPGPPGPPLSAPRPPA